MIEWVSLADMLLEADEERRRYEAGPWGPWRLDRVAVSLVLEIDGTLVYDIDLEHVFTSQAVTSWLAQLAEKDWASLEVLGGLVRAFDAVLDLNKLRHGARRRWCRRAGRFVDIIDVQGSSER